jgi:hypothetical protein
VPRLPVPSLELPLPGTSSGPGSAGGGPRSSGVPLPTVNLCLPPLPAIGNC